MLRITNICLLILIASVGVAAQTAKPAAKPDSAPDAGGSFAIESEMLTYSAVERSSQAIGCDVARLLYGTSGGAAVPCSFTSANPPLAPVVLISGSSTVLADFQQWRSDMATMQLLHRSAEVCGVPRGTAVSTAVSAAAHVIDLTPENQALGLVQTALGMFGSTLTRASLAGTVEDRALMNAVGRELRVHHVPVVVPEMYFPNALNVTSYADSPYFGAFGRLAADHDACSQALQHKDAASDQIKPLIDQMDAFIAAVVGTAAASNTTHAEPSAAEPVPTASHFANIVLADGFARTLGYTATGNVPTGWHVLWLKVLESGGSDWHRGNIFGSSDRLSGGSVVTYALFSPDGMLTCSGNVYSFGGPIDPNKISNKNSKAADSDPPVKTFASDSSCGS